MELGRDLLHIADSLLWQHKRSLEAAVASAHPEIVLLVDLFVSLDLACHNEAVVLHLDVDVTLLHPGQLGLIDKCIIMLVNVRTAV